MRIVGVTVSVLWAGIRIQRMTTDCNVCVCIRIRMRVRVDNDSTGRSGTGALISDRSERRGDEEDERKVNARSHAGV